jgi:hypothetical protein
MAKTEQVKKLTFGHPVEKNLRPVPFNPPGCIGQANVAIRRFTFFAGWRCCACTTIPAPRLKSTHEIDKVSIAVIYLRLIISSSGDIQAGISPEAGQIQAPCFSMCSDT